MHDWGEQYRIILTKASLRIALLSSYINDVRRGTTVLRLGMEISMEFRRDVGVEEEDRELK